MRKLSLSIAGVALALGAGTGAARAEIKIALDCPPNPKLCGTYVWSKAFSDYLNAKGVKAKLYKRGALGGEAERLDQVSQGLLEVSNSALQVAGKLDTLIFGAYLPYLFESNDQFNAAVAKAKLIEKINAKITPKGVRLLAFLHLGPPAGIFNTKHPIHGVADMKGLRMRALDKSQIALYQAWGAKGTIVPWKEVPNALQTGVADGYLNPVFVPVLFGHTDFIKYFTDAAISPAARIGIASEKWYRGLSAKERKTVDDAVAAAHKAATAWRKKAGPAMNAMAKAKGIKITTLSPAERAKFVELSKKVYTKGVMTPEQVKIWTDAAAAVQ
jgi:TRAP-type C4-dicarboxylate transport system substrate-binding protein